MKHGYIFSCTFVRNMPYQINVMHSHLKLYLREKTYRWSTQNGINDIYFTSVIARGRPAVRLGSCGDGSHAAGRGERCLPDSPRAGAHSSGVHRRSHRGGVSAGRRASVGAQHQAGNYISPSKLDGQPLRGGCHSRGMSTILLNIALRFVIYMLIESIVTTTWVNRNDDMRVHMTFRAIQRCVWFVKMCDS